MLALQVRYGADSEWLTIQQVETFEEGLYRLSYFYENYWPPCEYALVDADGTVLNQGRKTSVCQYCRMTKYMPREILNTCHSCTGVKL